MTIHAALKTPTYFKSLPDFGSEIVRDVQLEMDPMSFLTIDEFSMIGCLLMTTLERRC